MPKVRHLDKSIIEATDWETLEENLAHSQFVEYDSRDEFRKDMKRRAELWSATEIEINGNSRDFLMELERAGLLEVIELPTDRVIKPYRPYSLRAEVEREAMGDD